MSMTGGGGWCVYLIRSNNRTYIGSTTDVHRRLRQHNCELVGGARATRRWAGSWKLVCWIHGFASRGEACRWERIVKCRARGLGARHLALANLVDGIRQCPKKGSLPDYPVPGGLSIVQ